MMVFVLSTLLLFLLYSRAMISYSIVESGDFLGHGLIRCFPLLSGGLVGAGEGGEANQPGTVQL
jgi:hypothetical protein